MKSKIILIILLLFTVIGCSSKDKDEPLIDDEKIDIVEKDDKSENTNTDDENSVRKVKLDVPQSIQETYYYCVPASLQMVLKFNNIEKSQTKLAYEMNTSAETGTEYVDLARVANKYLFNNENVKENEPGYHVQTLALETFSQTDKDL